MEHCNVEMCFTCNRARAVILYAEWAKSKPTNLTAEEIARWESENPPPAYVSSGTPTQTAPPPHSDPAE